MASKDQILENHPCFGSAKNKGRIHLPVSPECNLFCNFCKRSIDPVEQRPGVSNGIITPQEALEAVGRALELCPELSVVGIAGPGDTLATDHALQTLCMVRKNYPELLRCMSTNGLLLPEKIEAVAEAGGDTLTITINAVDPDIQAQVCAGICYHGQQIRGREAAQILIANQLEGLRRVLELGVSVKINTVLVPGVNDKHIAQVAKTVGAMGVLRYNIIPLIPQHRFQDIPAPTCQQLDQARCQAEPYVEVFRHCQHCRADAVGVPGKTDCSQQIYLKRVCTEHFSHG